MPIQKLCPLLRDKPDLFSKLCELGSSFYFIKDNIFTLHDGGELAANSYFLKNNENRGSYHMINLVMHEKKI